MSPTELGTGSEYTATIPVTFNSTSNIGTMAALRTAGSVRSIRTYTIDPTSTT